MFKKFLYWVLSFSFLPLLVRWLVKCRHPRFMVRWVIKKYFIDTLKVDISEAELSVEKYETVLDFFTRRLRSGVRPRPHGNRQVISPVDGAVMNYGTIIDGEMLQVKGKTYLFSQLVGHDLAEGFQGGDYVTLYLSPRDYHRIHHPVDGMVSQATAYPGRLLPVNHFSLENFREVFSRNRRIVLAYNTRSQSPNRFSKQGKKKNPHQSRTHQLPCLSCWVGALNVGQMRTYFDRQFYLDAGREVVDDRERLTKRYSSLFIHRGDEAGCFELGSTVILIFPPHTIRWLPGLSVNKYFKVGEPIAQIRPKAV